MRTNAFFVGWKSLKNCHFSKFRIFFGKKIENTYSRFGEWKTFSKTLRSPKAELVRTPLLYTFSIKPERDQFGIGRHSSESSCEFRKVPRTGVLARTFIYGMCKPVGEGLSPKTTRGERWPNGAGAVREDGIQPHSSHTAPSFLQQWNCTQSWL